MMNCLFDSTFSPACIYYSFFRSVSCVNCWQLVPAFCVRRGYRCRSPPSATFAVCLLLMQHACAIAHLPLLCTSLYRLGVSWSRNHAVVYSLPLLVSVFAACIHCRFLVLNFLLFYPCGPVTAYLFLYDS